MNDSTRWSESTQEQLQAISKQWARKYTLRQLRAFQARYVSLMKDCTTMEMQNRWQCVTWAIDRKAFPELWK